MMVRGKGGRQISDSLFCSGSANTLEYISLGREEGKRVFAPACWCKEGSAEICFFLFWTRLAFLSGLLGLVDVGGFGDWGWMDG